ncbi:MAG TPA: exonuclease sbcCD subunit D, partial [Microbacterium ginsengisoli]|nr:exonuclease sbcCD subunit D [Microbacterium ginsengisoli]
VAHTPAGGRSGERTDYGARVRAARDDVQLVDAFLAHVRVGEGLSDDERAVLADVLAERSATEAAR